MRYLFCTSGYGEGDGYTRSRIGREFPHRYGCGQGYVGGGGFGGGSGDYDDYIEENIFNPQQMLYMLWMQGVV